MSELAWHRSSRCSSGGCVEVGYDAQAGHILVRDSKNPDQAPLRFTAEEWDAFAAGAGEMSVEAIRG